MGCGENFATIQSYTLIRLYAGCVCVGECALSQYVMQFCVYFDLSSAPNCLLYESIYIVLASGVRCGVSCVSFAWLLSDNQIVERELASGRERESFFLIK